MCCIKTGTQLFPPRGRGGGHTKQPIYTNRTAKLSNLFAFLILFGYEWMCCPLVAIQWRCIKTGILQMALLLLLGLKLTNIGLPFLQWLPASKKKTGYFSIAPSTQYKCQLYSYLYNALQTGQKKGGEKHDIWQRILIKDSGNLIGQGKAFVPEIRKSPV